MEGRLTLGRLVNINDEFLSFSSRIWRKVNSRKGIPHMPHEKNGTTESDDDDDDESKWNWYIS